MLRSDRIALDAEISHARLGIIERDLNNVVTFLDSLSTQSALLAGFAFVAFGELPTGTPDWMSVLLYLSTSISLGANLFVVCVGQLITIHGPTLALKGPAGSMEKAVNIMRFYRTLIFWMFVLGLVAFSVVIVALIFVYCRAQIGLLVISVLIIAFFFILTFVFSAQVLSEFNFVAPKLKYVVGSHLEVPGLSRPQKSKTIDAEFVPASDFLGLNPAAAKEHDAGKFGNN